MRRLSRGKYPGGYRKLWYWSQSRRLFRGGVGMIFAFMGSLTVDNLGSVSPSFKTLKTLRSSNCWSNFIICYSCGLQLQKKTEMSNNAVALRTDSKLKEEIKITAICYI